MALLQVEHETRYSYAWPVEYAQHMAFLRPLEDERQQVEAFEMTVDPVPANHASGRDVHGNQRVFFSTTQPHQSLRVLARSRVRLAEPPPFDPAQTPPWEAVADRLRFHAGAPFEPASEFCAPSPFVPRLPQEGAGLTLDELRTMGDADLALRLSALAARLADAGALLSDDVGRRYFAHVDGGHGLQQV